MKQQKASNSNQKEPQSAKVDEIESPSTDKLHALDVTKQEQSERPKRKAKTKEAMQRYLNRDVEFLQEKPEKKKSQNQPSAQAHTTPNQGKTSVNTLQSQSIKSSVTKSMDIQAPTRPIGPFASSLKAAERDLLQKSSVGVDPTQPGSSQEKTEANGAASSVQGTTNRLTTSSQGKNQKKKPAVVENKKSKTAAKPSTSTPAPSSKATPPSTNAAASSKPEADSKAAQGTSKQQAATKRATRSDPPSQPDASNATAENGKSPLKRKAAEIATSAILGQKNAQNKQADDQVAATKSTAAKTAARKDAKPAADKQPQAAVASATVTKKEKEAEQQEESDREEEEDDDDEEEEEEDEDMDDDANDDDLEEEGEDEDEELEDEDELDHGDVNDLKLRKKREFYLKEQRIANRALRIKMGKSGAQAATRKNIKKGKDACQRKLWNQGEDDAIVDLVAKYGTKRWTFIAQQLTDEYHIGGRTGKQCRERWHNHLDPSIKKSPINNEEERIIFDAHKIYGNKWADIAKLLHGRSDNCIKNYYYSTLRKHIRRINKSLKQCQVAKKLNLKVKCLTADILFPLVKESKITYNQVKSIDPKKFEDLEHTMRMIFNHEDGQQVTQRGIIAAAQNRLKVEQKLEEMRQNELAELKQKQKKRVQKTKTKDNKHKEDSDAESQNEEVMSDDQESVQGSKSKNSKTAGLAGKKREAESQAAGREPQGKRQRAEEAARSAEEEDTESEEEEDDDSDEDMEVDDGAGKDKNKKQSNQSKPKADKKGIKSVTDATRNKRTHESEDEDVPAKSNTKNKLSTKKNSTLLEEQFKNLDKKDKVANDLNPFSMDSETNLNQMNYSGKFGQSKESARLTGEKSGRNTSRENQEHVKLTSSKQKTVTGNLLKPTGQGATQNLNNRQVSHASNMTFGHSYPNLAGLSSVPIPKMSHGSYYSGFMPTLPCQSFYKTLPGDYYMSQAQRNKKREVTDTMPETEGNNGNVTKSKNANNTTNLQWQESGVSQRDKKDKKKKKKKDKKKSKKEREERYRSKTRSQFPLLPHNFIHSFGAYGHGYPDENGDLQDGNYPTQGNGTVDLLHLQQQKSSGSRLYPPALFPGDGRDPRDLSLRKGKDSSAGSIPFMFGPQGGHQGHMHMAPQNQGQSNMGGSQAAPYHPFEHMHGMPPIYYPYHNAYFFGQGNPHHQMAAGFFPPGMHPPMVPDEHLSGNLHEMTKTNKKNRQKSEESHQRKATNETKDSAVVEKTTKKQQQQSPDDKEEKENDTAEKNEEAKQDDKSAESDGEQSDSNSKSKPSKESQEEPNKEKKTPHHSFMPPEALGYCPASGMSHIPIQAFYQIGQTGKLQMPQHIGIPIPHAHHHPAMAFHQQYYQFGQMPPMNPMYGHIPHKSEHDNYQGPHQPMKHSKGGYDHKKKDGAQQHQGVPAQQPVPYRHLYNHNQFDMPPTPNNVKMQTLQKDMAGLIYSGQTPRAGQTAGVGGMHTPREGITPRSLTPQEGHTRRPRKFSNNSQLNEDVAHNDDSSNTRPLDNSKKPQSCFENSQNTHQQQPSAQYNNNIMFIKYAPMIRKRDKSHQALATDVKLFEQTQDAADRETKTDHEPTGQNVEGEVSQKKAVAKDDKTKQVSKDASTCKQMVVNKQFLTNLGEHIAQELFSMNQYANSQMDISDSEHSDRQNKQQSAQSVNKQNSSNSAAEKGQKNLELKTGDRQQSNEQGGQKKHNERKSSKDKDQNQKAGDKQMSPKRQGSQSKKDDSNTLRQPGKNLPVASFKQMKPRMGLNKDWNKTMLGWSEFINSKGITPSGGYGHSIPPLPSTSHFLANFVQNQGQLQQSVRNQQAQQALKSLKGNDLLNSQQANIGLNLFKRLQMTPKPHNSQQAKQSATPAGGTSAKHAFHAMNELFKKEAGAAADGNGSGGAPRLLSTKHVLNSGHSFNENNKLTNSRLNTKTNAQVTNQKIVTPKATMANDPEARNKILEKLLQSAAHQNEQNTEQKGKPEVEVTKDHQIQLGGAFTKKLKQMHSQKDTDEHKDIDKQEDNDATSFNGQRANPLKEADKDKDSLGLLQANQQAISQTLDLNQEPLSSLYTGAPENSKQKNQQPSVLGADKSLLSGSKQHSTMLQMQIQTPLLGGKIIENEDGNGQHSPKSEPKTKGFNLGNDSDVKANSKSKQAPKKRDKDSILDESVDNEQQKDYSQPQDLEMIVEADKQEEESISKKELNVKQQKNSVEVEVQDVDHEMQDE